MSGQREAAKRHSGSPTVDNKNERNQPEEMQRDRRGKASEWHAVLTRGRRQAVRVLSNPSSTRRKVPVSLAKMDPRDGESDQSMGSGEEDNGQKRAGGQEMGGGAERGWRSVRWFKADSSRERAGASFWAVLGAGGRMTSPGQGDRARSTARCSGRFRRKRRKEKRMEM